MQIELTGNVSYNGTNYGPGVYGVEDFPQGAKDITYLLKRCKHVVKPYLGPIAGKPGVKQVTADAYLLEAERVARAAQTAAAITAPSKDEGEQAEE